MADKSWIHSNGMSFNRGSSCSIFIVGAIYKQVLLKGRGGQKFWSLLSRKTTKGEVVIKSEKSAIVVYEWPQDLKVWGGKTYTRWMGIKYEFGTQTIRKWALKNKFDRLSWKPISKMEKFVTISLDDIRIVYLTGM